MSVLFTFSFGFICYYLFYELYLRCIAGLGVRGLVGIADGKDVVKLIVGGDVETVEEELALVV